MHLPVLKIGAVNRDDLTYLPSLEPPPAVSGHAFVFHFASSAPSLRRVRLQNGGKKEMGKTLDNAVAC